ncbi:MAG TPA: S46 family peptidase [Thermoanaerobaculia bacterium]|nr:S46 family peptidase [Thermoanaerobaculia bacterium]
MKMISILTVTFASVAFGQGMWMPQQVPQLAEPLKERGLELDPQQFADLTGFPMGAVVSTGGCSAALVSPLGLIATNHHCVYGYLQFNSTPERDLIRNGFLAADRTGEIQASPDSRIYVTTGIEEVTDRITGRIGPRLNDLERAKLIEKRRKEMIAQCEKPRGLRCRVDSFFAGTQYLKTTQMEIRDVRLAYAPGAGIGNYGGETDNWMWPRHTGDFGFLRAYVGPDGQPADHSPDNVPYQPKHWLRIATGDLDPGDLVIVAGYPGVTFRYETAEETRMKIGYLFPTSIAYRKELIGILESESARGREVAIRNASRIRSLANYLKKYQGTLDAFEKGRLADVRADEERRMRSLVSNDGELLLKHEAVMNELQAIFDAEKETLQRDTAFSWLYTASPMLSQADFAYEMSRQRAKRDADRDERYQERNWPRLRGLIARTQRQIEPGTDRAGLAHFLRKAAVLPPDQRIEAVDAALAATGESEVEAQIDSLLERIYSGTRIADQAWREDRFDDSTREITALGDPLIELAAALRPLKDANERREKEWKGAFSRLRPEYMNALRAVRGGLLAPDANGTLRVTFGEVVGYAPRDGVMYTPFTTAGGILEKNTGEGEFDAPARALELVRDRRFGPYQDPDLGGLPVNFLTTVDITNGNSGSATLNGRGELAGLAFDGNYEAMGSDYVFDEKLQRAIHVDSRYMLWVMDAVDGADHLLREMGIEPQIP